MKYLCVEPSLKGTYKGGVEFEYGRRTYRPLTIFLPISEQSSADQFASKVEQALTSFESVHFGSLDLASAALSQIRSAVARHKAFLAKPTSESSD